MFITVKKAANLLGFELHQVYYLLTMGEIEAVKMGKSWRLVNSAVQEYVEKLTAKKAP